ncbi:MAG: hypothetical protein JWN25_1635 [Verrucomicrobiales bacterium]|nr:hypothetical protein [Verrucomicrobiales bacterium]MDB6129793.1 hypothetical protein [Verrucomicrobiales bacterium]
MQRSLFSSFVKAMACAVLILGSVAVQAADANGSWTWTQPGRNGGPDRKSTLTLKVDGAKVTGKVSAPGQGGAAVDTDIADGKIDGDTVSFTVTREFNGNKRVAKYSGKVDGDTIKGKIETDRNGTPNSADWEAKREKKDDKK